MKNMSALLLIFVFAFSLTVQVAAEEPVFGPNLVVNGDFEIDTDENEKPDSWGLLEGPNWQTKVSTIILDESTCYTGEKSVRIECSSVTLAQNQTYGRIWQAFDVKAGEKYRIGAALKQNCTLGQAANIAILGLLYTDEDLNFDYMGDYDPYLVITIGTTAFDNYFGDITIPEPSEEYGTVVKMLVGIFAFSKSNEPYSGTVWIDSVSLRRMYTEPLVPPIVQTKRLANGQVELTWQVQKNTEGVGPTRFEVYRTADPEAEGTKVGDNIVGTTWIDTSLSNLDRGRYYYQVKAFDVANRFTISEKAIALGLASLSGTVTTSDAEGSPASTQLTLSLQGGETIAELTLGENGTFSFPNLIEGIYQLSLLKPNYQLLSPDNITLAAGDDESLSLELIYSVEPPNPPTGVTASTPDPGLVMLSWVAPSEGEAIGFYKVYRQEGVEPDFNAAELIQTNVMTTSYKDIEVRGGKRYIYFVVSVSLAGMPAQQPASSNSIVVVSPPTVQLAQPIEGEVIIDQKPTFEWEQLTGAASYTLEISKDENFGQGKVTRYANISSNSYPLSKSLDEGTWYWRVQPTFTTGVIGDFCDAGTFVMVISNPGLGGAGMIKLDQQHFAPRKGESVLGRFVLDKDSEVSLKLYSSNGKCVRTLLNFEQKESGNHSFEWNGKNQQGEYIPNGLYFIELFIKGADTKPIRAVGRVLVLN